MIPRPYPVKIRIKFYSYDNASTPVNMLKTNEAQRTYQSVWMERKANQAKIYQILHQYSSFGFQQVFYHHHHYYYHNLFCQLCHPDHSFFQALKSLLNFFLPQPSENKIT
jgi:hypothetical protein